MARNRLELNASPRPPERGALGASTPLPLQAISPAPGEAERALQHSHLDEPPDRQRGLADRPWHPNE